MRNFLKQKFSVLSVTNKSLNQQLRKNHHAFDKLNVCKSCGVVHGAPILYDYIDFYQDMYKIKKKSVYQRK